ncbi:phage holin family protein [Selenomonas noxia]|uniref:phage holin family protein n=1 Tax=Selenomonas noxia TaxID=135083 RepID=UPI0032BF9E90
MTQVLQRLQEGWGLKLSISCAVSLASHDHAQIFAAFVALVCLDLVTKWLSLSRKCLMDDGTEHPTFWQSFCGIRRARRMGYIRSEEMRTRFTHKILTYFGVVAAALMLDFMLLKTHAPAFAATVAIGYLALTEFVSILENMQQSGVEEAGSLVEIVRKKGGIAKGKQSNKSSGEGEE